MRRILGRVGVFLCDRCYPRPTTSVERSANAQYADLMIKTLVGEVPWYGRDRKIAAAARAIPEGS